MEIVEGKIVAFEPTARPVGQNQNFAQKITIEGTSGQTLEGEILVKDKNIVRGLTGEMLKWEKTSNDYGVKLKKHRDAPYAGNQGGQAGGSNGKNDRLIVAQVVFKVLAAVSSENITEDNLTRYTDMIMRVGNGQSAQQTTPQNDPDRLAPSNPPPEQPAQNQQPDNDIPF